jgi:predicted nucleic acid-binding protein
MAGVVVLDASALIALYDSQDKHHPWALQMFIDTIQLELAMPALTYAEVLVHPIRAGKRSKFEKSIRGLGISFHGLAPEDALELAELRVKTNLKMPDVVVLHRALSLNAAIATTDKNLAEQARKLSLEVFSSPEL